MLELYTYLLITSGLSDEWNQMQMRRATVFELLLCYSNLNWISPTAQNYFQHIIADTAVPKKSTTICCHDDAAEFMHTDLRYTVQTSYRRSKSVCREDRNHTCWHTVQKNISWAQERSPTVRHGPAVRFEMVKEVRCQGGVGWKDSGRPFSQLQTWSSGLAASSSDP